MSHGLSVCMISYVRYCGQGYPSTETFMSIQCASPGRGEDLVGVCAACRVVVRILVTFHYSLLLVTSAVGIRYLGFVTLIVTQALRAQRGSRVAAAVILIPNSISAAPLISWHRMQLQRAANTLKHTWTTRKKLRNYKFQIQNPSFITL